MSHIICWKCQRSIEPLERVEKDPKTNKRWLITYCQYERCGANLELEETKGKFPYPDDNYEDGLKPYKPPKNQSKWII